MQFKSGDFVVARGLPIDKVYFIESGKINALTSVKRTAALICTYESGRCDRRRVCGVSVQLGACTGMLTAAVRTAARSARWAC